MSHGGRTMAEQDASFREHGPAYDNKLFGMQLGHDLLTYTSDSGATQAAGLHVGAADARSRARAVYGGDSGHSHIDSVSGGLYWSWNARGGAYLDAVLQVTDYDAEITLAGQALRIQSDGRGYLASLEGGVPLSLRHGWLVEPQAQLVYQKVHFEDTQDELAEIHHVGVRALNGRLGARLGRQWVSPAGPGARGQLQLALSGELDHNFSAFASADYDFALDGRKGDGYGWRFGIRRMW